MRKMKTEGCKFFVHFHEPTLLWCSFEVMKSPWFNLTKVLLINRKFVGTYAQCSVVFCYSYAVLKSVIADFENHIWIECRLGNEEICNIQEVQCVHGTQEKICL
jgi:hypothetical protein